MKRLLTVFLMILPPLAAQSHWDSDWRVQDHQTINKTFKVAAGENASKLVIDQIHGFIHVTGGSGLEIQVTVEERIRADSQKDMDDAKHDEKLEMTQEGNTVKLYEDGPFRSSHNDSGWWDHRHYEVVFDSEIKVPAGVSLDLRTVNNTVEVKNTAGDFNVRTVNGRVTLQDMGGSGSAESTNGSVKVAFSRNPARESSFRTVNGSIDLYFHSVPDADMEFQTVHGGVFADFDVTSLPTTVKGEISGSRYVYRTDGHMKVRAGKGGPALNLRTVNGSIHMYSKGI